MKISSKRNAAQLLIFVIQKKGVTKCLTEITIKTDYVQSCKVTIILKLANINWDTVSGDNLLLNSETVNPLCYMLGHQMDNQFLVVNKKLNTSESK